jgi:hypothetical protein
MSSTEIVSAALALIITIGLFVLLALGQPIPDFLTSGFGLVLGFFFGNQTGILSARLK